MKCARSPRFRCLYILLAISCFLAARAAYSAEARKPNVLFIAVDDLNDWEGCLHGHPQAHTPNIDQLASRGTLFANAQCQAPLCNPSRSSLLTGMRPSSTGIYGLAPGIRAVDVTRDRVTLPQYFAQNGYFTASFGKVFHDGAIPVNLRAAEFNVWGPAPGMPRPPQNLVPHAGGAERGVDWGVFPQDGQDNIQCDWITADNAIAQFKNRPKDKPFFLAVGFRLPHVPCYASQKWFDLIGPADKIILPPFKEDDRDDVPAFAWYLHWKLPEPRLSWLKKNNQWQNIVHSYLASTAFMDSQLGRVLDAVKEGGAMENTIVVLWGDNGWHLGEKGITGKNSLWARSTHVPLIFAGPGVSKGVCTQPAELLDIYPTLVEHCGLASRTDLEGHSLEPQLKDASAPRKWPAITTANEGNHSIRSEKWRYILYADGSQELYDTVADPNEWTNLAQKPEYAPIIRELKAWIPKVNLPAAPGSAHRILEKRGEEWFWEGKPIDPSQLEK